MTPDPIEEAVADALLGCVDPYYSTAHEAARAAIAAHLAALDAAGYAVAPKEPTKLMLHAAAKAMSPARRPTPERVSCNEKHAIRYRAMIAALGGQ